MMGTSEIIQPPPVDAATSAVATLSISDTFPNALDFLPRHSDVEWNTWLHNSIGHLTFDFDMGTQPVHSAPVPPIDINPVEFDNLMSAFGWAPEWSANMELGIEIPGS